jgi:hypothetical protein
MLSVLKRGCDNLVETYAMGDVGPDISVSLAQNSSH